RIDLRGENPLILRGLIHPIKAVSVSNDGRQILAADLFGEAIVWDQLGKELRRLRVGTTSTINAMCFSPDGRFLVIADSEGALGVCDTTTGQRFDLGRG